MIFDKPSSFEDQLFSETLYKTKMNSVTSDKFPKNDEIFISVIHSCLCFFDSIEFLEDGSGKMANNLKEDDLLFIKD